MKRFRWSLSIAGLGVVLVGWGLWMALPFAGSAARDSGGGQAAGRLRPDTSLERKFPATGPGRKPLPGPKGPLDAILKQPDGPQRDKALEEFLQARAGEDPVVIAEAFLASADHLDLRRAFAGLIPRWIERAPDDCIRWLEQAGLTVETRTSLLQAAYAAWSRQDPNASLASATSTNRSAPILNAAFAAAADVDFDTAFEVYQRANRETKVVVVESMALIAASHSDARAAGLVDEFVSWFPQVRDQVRLGRNLVPIDRKLAESMADESDDAAARADLRAGIFRSTLSGRAVGFKEAADSPSEEEDRFADDVDASAPESRAVGNQATR